MVKYLTDIACRLSLMAAVVLLLWTAWQIRHFLLMSMILTAAWRFRQRRMPLSNAYGKAQWLSYRQAARAGMFTRNGFFLGRFDGEGAGRLWSLYELFTLPLNRSAQAVRGFLNNFGRPS